MYSPTVVHVSLTVKIAAGGTRRSSLACLVFTAALANVDRAPRRSVMHLRGVFCFKALSERFPLRCVYSFHSGDYSELTGNVFPNSRSCLAYGEICCWRNTAFILGLLGLYSGTR
jgi:hypothetical protein